MTDCPCTYSGCSRKGNCRECLKYHLERDELPACCFSKEAEATYDRSFRKFAEDKNLIPKGSDRYLSAKEEKVLMKKYKEVKKGVKAGKLKSFSKVDGIMTECFG